MRARGTFLAATAVALSLLLAPAAAAQRSNPPPPPGANNACRLDQNPTPVVLVHGTFANRYINFIRIAPYLEDEGYCTWALNYGDCNEVGSCARGPVQHSARELKRFIDTQVLPRSRSGKVSIVGHSQGGLMPRYYIKFLGGRSVVRDMVSLSASNHGSDNPLAPFAVACAACRQQAPYRSAFTALVNRGDETPGRVHYTQIQTRFDDFVFPYFSSYLADDPDNEYNGPRTRLLNGPRTTNLCLQDRYPNNFDDHLTIAGNPQPLEVIREALERPGPAAPPPGADTVCARFGGDPSGGVRAPGGSGRRARCTIAGTPGNDVLRGTPRDDVICAGGGNDVVRPGSGADLVYAGNGNDVVRGDAGTDRLRGEDGRDTLNASDDVRGNDSVDGGAGRDVCNGDLGDGRASCP